MCVCVCVCVCGGRGGGGVIDFWWRENKNLVEGGGFFQVAGGELCTHTITTKKKGKKEIIKNTMDSALI